MDTNNSKHQQMPKQNLNQQINIEQKSDQTQFKGTVSKSQIYQYITLQQQKNSQNKQGHQALKQHQNSSSAQNQNFQHTQQLLGNNGNNSNILANQGNSSKTNNFSLQDCDLSNLSKTQLIEMVQRSKQSNNELKKQITKAKELQAKIQIKSEAEEDFISNKLVQKLEQVQKEKLDIQRKVQQEEEHIQNYLHRKLQEINRERLEIEQQLEDEQNFLLSTLNKQLRDVNQRKEALRKKLEREQREKQELIDSIESEQKYLRDTLQKKLDQIQREKESLLKEIESEESERIANLQIIIDRILSEKNKVEDLLSQEVREKQLLVLALENQKSNLTNELQGKIDEIKKHRNMIQKQLQFTKDGMMPGRSTQEIMKMSALHQDNQANKSLQDQLQNQEMTLKNKQMLIDANNSSNNSTPRIIKTKSEIQQKMIQALNEQQTQIQQQKSQPKEVISQNLQINPQQNQNLMTTPTNDINQQPDEDQTKSLLQRDMEYYEQEQKRMIQKIMSLTTQLEEIKQESAKYKKMWDDVKLKMRKGDQQKYFQEMMMMHIYKGGQMQGHGSTSSHNQGFRTVDPYKRNKNHKHQIHDSSAENSFNNDFLS